MGAMVPDNLPALTDSPEMWIDYANALLKSSDTLPTSLGGQPCRSTRRVHPTLVNSVPLHLGHGGMIRIAYSMAVAVTPGPARWFDGWATP
ncbi:MAG: hypothetical protein JXQ75_05775, partial [Phycisphaerae bacterium]|nr:hypothetical protein [Phycisphaerae bacterium]